MPTRPTHGATSEGGLLRVQPVVRAHLLDGHVGEEEAERLAVDNSSLLQGDDQRSGCRRRKVFCQGYRGHRGEANRGMKGTLDHDNLLVPPRQRIAAIAPTTCALETVAACRPHRRQRFVKRDPEWITAGDGSALPGWSQCAAAPPSGPRETLLGSLACGAGRRVARTRLIRPLPFPGANVIADVERTRASCRPRYSVAAPSGQTSRRARGCCAR